MRTSNALYVLLYWRNFEVLANLLCKNIADF